MAPKEIPFIVLHGTPAERGRQHGAALRACILTSLTSLRNSFSDKQWDSGRTRSAACLQKLEALAPSIVAELRGIADATNLHVHDVLLLSAFEFLGGHTRGCTSAALSRPAGAVVAQNWDAPASTDQHLVVFVHEGADERFICIASAGTLGWVGMNGHGLAFVNNDLILDEAENGLPSLVIRRLMLAERNVDAANSVLRSHKHLSGRCFTLGDAQGRLRLVEVGPSSGVTDRALRFAVHTNHPIFAKPAMWEDIEAVARVYPSSRSRLRAARAHSLNSVDDIHSLLCDRSDAPDAISKSPSRREPTGTAFSVIFDCGRREALIATGRPDLSSYRRISLLQHASV
ncbi:C45 family peptidase [Rhizobium sp. BG4]|uniref:C45 family autoproteolytic acyltransferase/hydolase n=1 Tax=Rhizobium sp. BG4 TaxID=2613770 RepID=UPI00193CB5DC|nr:C45 family peptidase [Rhizobium sp. BG4]